MEKKKNAMTNEPVLVSRAARITAPHLNERVQRAGLPFNKSAEAATMYNETSTRISEPKGELDTHTYKRGDEEARNETTASDDDDELFSLFSLSLVLVETALISTFPEESSLRLSPLGAERAQNQPREEEDAHLEAGSSWGRGKTRCVRFGNLCRESDRDRSSGPTFSLFLDEDSNLGEIRKMKSRMKRLMTRRTRRRDSFDAERKSERS